MMREGATGGLGGVIVIPLLFPKLKLFVAVAVPPPENVMSVIPAHEAVKLFALEIVAAVPLAFDEICEIAELLPVSVSALVIVVVTPFPRIRRVGAVSVKVAIVGAPVMVNVPPEVFPL